MNEFASRMPVNELTLPDASSVEFSDIPTVRARLKILDSQLELRQLQEQPAELHDPASFSEDLIDVSEIARLTGMSVDWVYRHAGEWTFTRKISHRALRFNRRGAEAWLNSRKF